MFDQAPKSFKTIVDLLLVLKKMFLECTRHRDAVSKSGIFFFLVIVSTFLVSKVVNIMFYSKSLVHCTF